MLCQLFAEFGLTEPRLEINSLGCPACRPAYREALRSFLEQRAADLCADCQRRMQTNPLRALDCKVPGCKEATAGAPAMLDNLCTECADHFALTRKYLDESGTPYEVNSRMVRGLDYYTRTTFELVTGLLGSQSAVAAGGRYDGLVADLGGPALPGIGFALGVERVALLVGKQANIPGPTLFIAALGEAARSRSFTIMCDLQRQGVSVEMDYEGKSLKSQMRRADKLNARFVLIVGESEVAAGTAQLKNMQQGTQVEVALAAPALMVCL
jgi:histidyl-tRNA synthetase